MHRKFILCAVGGLSVIALASAPTDAAILHSFSSADAALSPDDGYDPAATSITLEANTLAPADGTALAVGVTGLNRFWNSEFAGFSLSSPNLQAIDNATEFGTGYFTWTVSAKPGFKLNLESLNFGSVRGGATNVRGYEIYAAVNGGAFTFGDVPLKDVDDEVVSATRTAPLATAIDLSGPAYQNIDSITFRYYALTQATGNTIEFNTMALNGTATAVPEPAAGGAVAAAAALVLGRRRRQAR